MSRSICKKLLFTLLALLLGGIAPVFADEEPLEALGFLTPSEEELVSTSRHPRPTSKTAENITVITADDIERLNAHTLADVLQSVPGIVLDYLRTPTTFSFFNIQGALSTTVLVFIDGIRQNDFQQGMAVPGLIPVQQIERIEIIRGAASTAWGPALGGVINIITKTPTPDRPAAGMVSGSVGTQFTADTRAELSGTADRFGYYLTAGNIRSDGLTPNTSTNLNNLYGKLSYHLPSSGTATFGLSRLDARPGLDEGDTVKWGFVHDNNVHHRTNGFLKFNQPLGSNLSLDVDGYFTYRDDHSKWGGIGSDGAITFFSDYVAHETTRGTNARLIWDTGRHSIVTGIDYGHVNARGEDLLNPPPSYIRSWDGWAFYGNGAWSIGRLTILPGIRHDITGISGDNTSYTLGATYQLSDNTTLRAYGAEGFSLPQLNLPAVLQKVRTFQGGIESGAVPHLWLKGTWFHNTLRDSSSLGVVPVISNQTRQGFEVEARTTPLFGFSAASGYTYLYARNSDTGERLQTDSSQSVPPHLLKLALNYHQTDLGLRGTMTGNYVWWNSPVNIDSRSSGMIWDLHLNWKLYPESELSPELFVSGHNLFNGVQTTSTELYTNPKRWFDGGLRVRF